jgi:hypothetical protein
LADWTLTLRCVAPEAVMWPGHESTTASLALHRNDGGAQDARVEGVLAALAVIVLVGAVAGNLYAQKRRARPRESVYDVIRRRLESERARRDPER